MSILGILRGFNGNSNWGLKLKKKKMKDRYLKLTLFKVLVHFF
jgi:hypothetical protein